MEAKDYIPIVVATIAGIVALVVAVLNYLATKRLERVKGTYSLLNRDLEKLEQMNAKFKEFSIPNKERVASTLQKEGEQRETAFQALYDDLNPQYHSASIEVLANKAIFDNDLEESNSILVEQVSSASNGGEEIGYRIQALMGFLNNISEQISRTRDKLTSNA